MRVVFIRGRGSTQTALRARGFEQQSDAHLVECAASWCPEKFFRRKKLIRGRIPHPPQRPALLLYVEKWGDVGLTGFEIEATVLENSPDVTSGRKKPDSCICTTDTVR